MGVILIRIRNGIRIYKYGQKVSDDEMLALRIVMIQDHDDGVR